MSMTLSKNFEVILGTEDGYNFDKKNIALSIYKSEEFEGKVVASGLTEKGFATIEELESLLEDMKYIESKD